MMKNEYTYVFQIEQRVQRRGLPQIGLAFESSGMLHMIRQCLPCTRWHLKRTWNQFQHCNIVSLCDVVRASWKAGCKTWK